MKQIFDVIRHKWVRATPEEIVRQIWIERMVNELSFPRPLVSVEKELKELPDIKDNLDSLPSRRIDIVCYRKEQDLLRPLLLIECKQSLELQPALDQVKGYNTFVKAPYIAVANRQELRFYFQTRYGEGCLKSLPSYPELLKRL
jgi:hypothetical protein